MFTKNTIQFLIRSSGRKSFHGTRTIVSSSAPPKPWHKVKEVAEGEIKQKDEFEGVKPDGRGAYIVESDQQRYLNEEIGNWKAEKLEDYYDMVEPTYPDIPKSNMSQDSIRCGLIAMKVGCTNEWDPVWGQFHMCTVLLVEKTRVIQVKTKDKDGYDAIQIGTGTKRLHNFNKPQLGHFLKWGGAEPLRHLKEFRVTPDALLPVGSELGVRQFVPGQHIDIQGITTGRGYAGVMKRWGFRGQPASHGAGVHRHPGGMGGAQDPGRVFPGKRMGGHLGVDKRTVANLLIYKINPSRGLIYVKGSIPGHKGNIVYIKDAVRLRRNKKELKINKYFPTFTMEDYKKEGPKIEDIYLPFNEVSPFEGEDDRVEG